MSGQNDWWRSKVPPKEEVLWVGQPDQRLIPKQYSFLFELMNMFAALAWITQLFLVASPWEFLLSFKLPLFATAVIFGDYYHRINCYYFVSNKSALIVRKHLFSKQPYSKHVEITPSLKFKSTTHKIKLKPFFSFDYLQDTDAALKALTQAQEASK